jgi:PAS domain S-box-containing protein
VARDITDPQRVEGALRASEEQLLLFVEHAPAAIAMFDRDMRYLAVSRRFLSDYRLSLRDVIGRSHYEIFPEIPERWKDIHRRCLAGTVERCDEDPFPRADGTLDWVRWEIHPWRDAAGNIGGIILFSEVITERKRSAEWLRESEERFRLLVHGVKDCAIYMLAPDGTVKSWSGAAEQIFGYREEEIIGQHRAIFFTEEDRRAGQPQKDLEEAAAHGLCEQEGWRVKKDGSLFWANVLITALRDDAGRLRGFASVFRDFTERKKAEVTLRESEERYRSLFEHMSEGLAHCRMVYDGDRPVDFVYLDVNPAFEFLTGLRGVAGKKVSEVFPGILESDPGLIERYARVARQRTPERFEIYVESLGHWFDISVYSPARGEFVALFHIITDRKRVEEELRASEERLRMAQQAARVGSFNWDIQSGVNTWSPELEALYGLPRGGFPQTEAAWENLVHPDDRIEAIRRVDRALESGGTTDAEWRVMWPDGSVHWIAGRWQVLKDDFGAPLRMTGINFDITDRKRIEEELRASEERMRLAQQVARVGTFEWDIQTGINTWTPETEALYGLPPGSFGRTEAAFEQLVHPEDRDQVLRWVERAMETGAPGEGEWRAVWPDGSVHWITARWQVLRDRHGKPVRMTGINMDITESKRAEELRASEAALREADRQKNQFLATLSHELRNPLAPIRNSLYILERASPGSERARKAQAILNRQVGQLNWLIDDLLDVTRITHGKVQLQRERVDLNELAHRTVEDHRTVFAKSEVRLEVLPAAAEVWINGDRVRLAQVVGNLLQNAVKFTPHGGKATVSVQADVARGQAALTVRDTGAGIEPQMLPRLFHPFSQADATLDRSKGGLGLGLALVKGLVELHGGSVSVASEGLGKGAAFTISLPIDISVAQATARRGLGKASEPRRVLVIEDNEDAAQSLRDVLELDEHLVEVAYSGRDGIDKARVFHPDIVLCDIGLPEMDGYEVARAIRADPVLGHVGLIALSGYAQPEDVAMAKEAGFDAHLAKPPSVEALERALVGSTHEEQPAQR